IPNAHLLYSAQAFTQRLYPKVVQTLRSLAGGGMIMLPSGIEDFSRLEHPASCVACSAFAGVVTRGSRKIIQACVGYGGFRVRVAAHATKCFTLAPSSS